MQVQLHRSSIAPLVATLLLAASGTTWASSMPSPPLDELSDFYHALDGDEWHRNDHWLDEDVHPCQWYGIHCGPGLSPPAITHIWLSSNNLAGDLEDVADLILDLITPIAGSTIDLSGNRITGAVPASLLTGELEWIDLSNNQLGGGLPDVTPSLDLRRLNLANNQLTDKIPAGLLIGTLEWLNLSDNSLGGALPDFTPIDDRLRTLALSGNRLKGSLDQISQHSDLQRLQLADNLFQGAFPEALLTLEQLRELDLSDNDFSGKLPAQLVDLEMISPNAYWLGGLNLCWNDFEVGSGKLDEWLRAHHAGVEYERCLGVERQPLDASVSGSWFQPSRSGEGSTLQLLDTGDALIYWFTFTRFGNQMWLFGTAFQPDLDGPTIAFPTLYRPEGFPTTDGSMVFDLVRRGRWRYDRRVDDHLVGLQIYDINISVSGFERQPVGLRVDHAPLSRINGTRCDDDPNLPDISGVWHDPDLDMDGFVVEMMASGQVLVYWFTWVPGTALQAWMMGVGDLVGDGRVIIEELHRPTGTRFGDDFDPEEVTRPVWGQLELVFDDEHNGHAWWTSENDQWESGDRPIQRLTRPKLAECD